MQRSIGIGVVLGAFAALVPIPPARAAEHPCLLFTAAELPALRAKVADGGPDDDAYTFIRDLATTTYPQYSLATLSGSSYGMYSVPNLGIAAHFPPGGDATVMALGRDLTLYIADTYAVDFDEAGSALRLRALVLGYDLFFADADEATRAYVRDEIKSYLQVMANNVAYEVFEYRPYLGNHSAMLGAALGLAGICMQGELTPALLSAALGRADRICNNLFQHQVDPEGAYKEGVFYGAWSMRHLIYYFHARKRFDGVDFGAHPRVRAMERWFAYELLPAGAALTLNLNESNYYNRPITLAATYFDWATGEWGSGLSAYIREHVSGVYGVDGGEPADKAGTALWYQPVAPVNPGTLLPSSRMFIERGLYHFRTGWPTGASSDDLVFAFSSGKFHGGHWQEDIGQFVMHGYGTLFVVDHGAGGAAKQSEAHNLVFVDGAGQHNAGSSIGTDGNIAAYLINGFADHILGDATSAYTTYSEFNVLGRPLPGIDWSWGYHGANPVIRAMRRVVAAHDDLTPPYFVVMDDVEKDGAPHLYEWRMHTLQANTVNTTDDPMRISGPYGGGMMRLYLLSPDRQAVSVTTGVYDNATPEPNSTMIRISHTDVAGRFTVLLLPLRAGEPPPQVAEVQPVWGAAATLDWGGGLVDYFLRNDSGGVVAFGPVTTDARAALVRTSGGAVHGYLACEATELSVGGAALARFFDGPATCALSGSVLRMDRLDADFRFLDTGVTTLCYHEQTRSFAIDDGYLVPGGVTGATGTLPAATLDIQAFPNPFNPFVRLRVAIALEAEVAIDVFDVAGRRVRALWQGRLPAGGHTFVWGGDEDGGARAASGVYFVRLRAEGNTRVVKITLVE